MANGLAGIMMAAVGVFHEAAGLLIYRAPLAEMLGAGLVNTVLPNLDPAHHGRQAAFWFLVAGPVLVMLGALATWAERRAGTLPRWLGWSLLVLTIIGTATFPNSAFWALFVPAFILIRDTRRAGAAL